MYNIGRGFDNLMKIMIVLAMLFGGLCFLIGWLIF